MSSSNPPIYWFNGIIFNPNYFTDPNASASGSGVSQAYVDNTFLKKAGDVATGLISFVGGTTTETSADFTTTPFITWNPTNSNYIINDSTVSTVGAATRCTVIGHTAGDALTDGSYNTFYGYNAGTSTDVGESNTFIGRAAGRANTNGINNTYVGEQAGLSATGKNNTIIGAFCDSGGFDNTTLLGVGASATSSNQVVLGSSGQTVRAPGSLSYIVNNDNTAGTYYLTFTKTPGAEGQIYCDSVTGPLTYNPSTSSITCGSFDGPTPTTNAVFASTTTSGSLNIGTGIAGSQTCNLISNGAYTGTLNVFGGSVSAYMYVRGNIRAQYGFRTGTSSYTFQNDNLGYRIAPTLTWNQAITSTITNATSFTIDNTTIAYGVYSVNVLLNIVNGATPGLIYASLSVTSASHSIPMTYNYYQASTQQSSQINWTITAYASTTFYVVVNSGVGVTGTIQNTGTNTSTILLTRIG